MWAARDALLAQGVRYAGHSRHSGAAARAVAGLRSPYSRRRHPAADPAVGGPRRGIRGAPEQRADVQQRVPGRRAADAIRRIVDDLDPARVHVVVTLRPLARMLASRWQQNVQTGETIAFDAWLDDAVQPPGRRAEACQCGSVTATTGCSRAGPTSSGLERMTVVVVDDRDHAAGAARLRGPARAARRHAGAPARPRQPIPDPGRGRGAAGVQRRLQVAPLGRAAADARRPARRRGTHEARRPAPRRAADRDAPVGPRPRGRDRRARWSPTSRRRGSRSSATWSRLVEVPASGLTGDRLPDPAIPP